MADKLRIGFIGCGGMARAHKDALSGVADVQIAAVTDAHRQAAVAFADQIEGAKVYDTPDQLARESGVDAIYILLPPFAHGDAEQAVIKHKIPFFIEKPIGLDKALIQQTSRQVQEAGIMSCAGYMNRYRKGVNGARDILQKDPAHLAYGAWFGGSRKPVKQGIGSWWPNKAKSGGQFHEQVTHTVDMARYLMGDAAQVSAFAANGFNDRWDGYTMDDAAVVNIQFASGAVANLMASAASNAKGGVFLNVLAGQHAFEFTGWEHSVLIRRAGETEGGVIKGEDEIFRIEDEAFLEAVRKKDPGTIRSTYPDAAKTALLTLAANESMAQNGRPVDLKG